MRLSRFVPRLLRWRTLAPGALGGLGILTLVVSPVAAHTPTAGAVAEYDNSPVVTLGYLFSGSYPDWFDGPTGAARTALEVDLPNRTYNNSRLPLFALTSGSNGRVVYSSASNSPCSGSNLDWIACASGGGTTSWRIYVRNFGASGKPTWNWSQAGCPSGESCFDARRAILHEALHVTMGIANHDTQSSSYTLMRSVTPSEASGDSTWDVHHIQRCDEAAAQLVYDVVNSAGVYGDCFDDIANAGTNGLRSNLTVSGTSFSGCVSTPIPVSGRIEIKDYTSYALLGGNPLTSRTLSFYRRLQGSTTWNLFTTTTASNASGDNWTKSVSGGIGTYEYQVRYAGEAGVDPVNSPIFTVAWRGSPCPI